MLDDDLTEDRLFELYVEKWSESQTLEFKRDLPGKADSDKSEFLKDICAFANSDGGDLLYGVDETEGVASNLTPITEPTEPTIRRLLQTIDAGIEPRIVGLRIIDVPLSKEPGYILRVKVPASFNGPHRYAISNRPGRFVMRDGTHTREFTYAELRTAFDRTATLAERARRFRDERTARVAARRTWRPIKSGPVCVVHLIPISAMAGNRNLDIARLYNEYTPFILPDWRGATRSTNLDGLIVHPGTDPMLAYVQLFRNGAFEAVRFGGRLVDEEQIIPSRTVSEFWRSALKVLLDAAKSLGISGPAVVGASLVTVSGFAFAATSDGISTVRPTDRDNLDLPEIWLDDVGAVDDVDEVARPILDVLWQAFDFETCYDYTSDGKWRK